MKKVTLSILIMLIFSMITINISAQGSDPKTLYIFPLYFNPDAQSYLTEESIIWHAEPFMFRLDDSEDLKKSLDKEAIKKRMHDPEVILENKESDDVRLYCIVTYREGVNIYKDTSNIYIAYSPKGSMNISYEDEKVITEPDINLLNQLSAILPDKKIQKSIKKAIASWNQ